MLIADVGVITGRESRVEIFQALQKPKVKMNNPIMPQLDPIARYFPICEMRDKFIVGMIRQNGSDVKFMPSRRILVVGVVSFKKGF